MWSAEKDDLEATQRQRLHLSALSVRNMRSLFQETVLDKDPVCNESHKLVTPYLLKRRRAALRQMCTSRDPAAGKPHAHATCGRKGNPVLLAVRYKSHTDGFDDNMVLPPGASSEAAQKAEPESSTKGMTSCSFFETR